MSTNPLLGIHQMGQSVWLDYLRRGMLVSGELSRYIDEDGLRGMTSNPTIFEKAIDGSEDYSSAIRALAQEGKSSRDMYDILTIDDVRQAADIFRPTYEQTEGGDGYVSLEVSPHLARDTKKTIEEARRLWEAVDRPNVMIKVPGTPAGLPAIQELTSEGVNVNVTLLFGLDRYRAVAESYLAGLEARADAHKPIGRVASVASFFLSRIDVMVDPMLEKIMKKGGKDAVTAGEVRGQVAIASARIAYKIYREVFEGQRFARLAEIGAKPQRVLWASTSTKNPEYSDIKYVEPLIGPNTINTMPTETMNAYRNHGAPENRIELHQDKALKALEQLSLVGIDLNIVTQKLEDEGIEKFVKPYDRLLESLEQKRKDALSTPVDTHQARLGEYQEAVDKRLKGLGTSGFVDRLWRKDASLWTSDPMSQEIVGNGLGWLHVAEKMVEAVPILEQFASDVRAAGFKHVVHMGMGGSSLAPLAFQRSFDVGDTGLPLTVLDTTDPGTIRDIEDQLPLADTLFIVASKSGTTTEPIAFGDYFYDRLYGIKKDRAGENFAVITDPGTPLVSLAEKRNYRKIFLNFKDIGGRYSALSYFGMVPAALMGVDIGEILERALRMAHACASSVPVEKNPGVRLGAMVGELARQGRDKLTFITTPQLGTFGMWLEQLLAESTGKEGKGILPVAGESLGDPSVYGKDRVFAYIALGGKQSDSVETAMNAIASAGHPVITIRLRDELDLGQEFLRWQIATATAGAVIGINAFDQPNVQESKDNTNRLLKEVEDRGRLREEEPIVTETPLRIYGEGTARDAASLLSKFLDEAHEGDYVALQAYLNEQPESYKILDSMRLQIRDRRKIATTLGYGPRFLHSTGQYHKGGPNTGLFIQLTAEDSIDLPITDRRYSFGILKQAQMMGDFEALRKHERRVIRIDLGPNVLKGLTALQQALSAVPVHH